jgi:hypothetical protein
MEEENERLERKDVLGIVLTLLAAGMLMTVLPADASPTTVLSVQPTSIVDPTLVPGSIFQVDITVDDVGYLWAWQFSLWFDPAILNVTDYWGYAPFENLLFGEVDNDVGYVAFGAYTFDGMSAVDPTPIAAITFMVKGVGTTTLHFDPDYTELWNALDYVIVDGYFDNTGPIENTQHLIETIETWSLPTGTENTLTSKLSAAINLLNLGNENGALHKLDDFISNVEAFRGKKLTDEQADYLVSEAQKIIGFING